MKDYYSNLENNLQKKASIFVFLFGKFMVVIFSIYYDLVKNTFRMSFVGGTDYFTNFETNGKVIVSSINKYLYVLLNKKHDQNLRVSYSETENVSNINYLKHELIRETLRYFKLNKAIEVVTSADIPSSGSGLGSSSALTVGLANAIS